MQALNDLDDARTKAKSDRRRTPLETNTHVWEPVGQWVDERGRSVDMGPSPPRTAALALGWGWVELGQPGAPEKDWITR
eukprot:1176284-Pyramimonas_sp.AAC.1